MRSIHVWSFNDWRLAARQCLSAGVDPADVNFVDGHQTQALLEFEAASRAGVRIDVPGKVDAIARMQVPRSFLKLARFVACHRHPCRYQTLYRLLWRLTQGEKDLLQIITDDDVHRVRQWNRQVRRDAHKMKAFVRFRKCRQSSQHQREWFIAWYRPDHRIVPLVASFFAERFATMCWSILCPDESVYWDQQHLRFGPGLPREAAPQNDELERLWLTYYRATFNPARVKLSAMKAEMPVRYWSTLVETEAIGQLVDEAPERLAAMLRAGRRGDGKNSQS